MSTTAGTAVAPSAPGRLGSPVDPTQLLHYLEALGAWRDQRHRELDVLDEAALASPQAAALTADVTLSMALWKAVADRHDQLLAVWDSGRVGQAEREHLSALIWGRLDTSAAVGAGAGGPMAVWLPEACRLSDALAASLRSRLALDPVAADVGSRLRQLRAGLERLREQLTTVPEGGEREHAAARVSRLAERVAAVSASAQRGGDVAGPLGPLEAECATAERDLIVGAARRRQGQRDRARAGVLREDLQARAAAAGELAARCVASVAPAPRLAIPDVATLGPVPEANADPAELARYLGRLDQVSRALRMAEDAYAGALARRDELAGRLGAYRAKADRAGLGGDPLLEEADRAAEETLAAEPVDLARAEALVELYPAVLRAVGTRTADVPPASRPGRPSGAPQGPAESRSA